MRTPFSFAARGDRLRLIPLICVLLLAQACDGRLQTLEPSALREFGRFGRDIDIDVGSAVVGAYQESSQQGAAYVYRYNGRAWSLEARLVSPTPADEQFGDRVAIDANTIAVAAPLDHRPGAVRAGSVYIFERTAGAWTHTATLGSPASQAWEAFGSSLTLDGNTLVVGAVDRDQGGATDAGAAFVFERTGSAWNLIQTLSAPLPAASDKFGNAVDLVGSTLVVAALRRDQGRVVDSGAVYVYQRDRAFTLTQTLTASDAISDDIFGVGVALFVQNDGARRLVVGAENADPAGFSRAGAAYVFESAPAAAFGETQKLIAADPQANAIFGDDVALFNERILIGAPGATGAVVGSGAAYEFQLDGGTFVQVSKLERDPSDAQAHFGNSVALIGGGALIGATGEEIGTLLDDTGAVHAFNVVDDALTHGHVLTASAAGGPGFRRLAMGDSTLVLGGATYADVFRRDASGWSEEQHLPALPFTTLTGVATDGDSVVVTGRRATNDPSVILGYAQVFTRVDDNWALQQQLAPDLVSVSFPEESANSLVTDVDGDTLVIGARRWNLGDGRVFVYERAGGIWTQSQLFTSPQAAGNFDMNFGNQVRLDGNTLVIAEVPSSGIPMSPQNGNVFIYTRPAPGADFVQQQVITAPVPAMGDLFGAGIAIDGDLLAIYSGSGAMLRVYRRTAGVFNEIYNESVPNVGGSFEIGLAMAGDAIAIGRSGAAVDAIGSAGEIQVRVRQPDDSYLLAATYRSTAPLANQALGQTLVIDADRVVAGTAPGRLFSFERTP